MATSLLIGVVAGIAIVGVGTVLWRLGQAIWTNIAHESSVGGEYSIYDDHACVTKVGEARIKQHGTRVYVKVERNISRDGTYYDTPTKFLCDGFFRSGVLTALFFDTEASYRPGSICLYYDTNEAALAGKATYYRSDGGVASYTLKFVRRTRRHTDL